MTKVKTYRELIVWQKSFDLVKSIYRLTKKFPDNEIYGLTSQIRRAAVSIPSNIAEGFSRRHKNDFIRFLLIASGSTSELETQLLLARDLSFVDSGDVEGALSILQEISKMLHSLINKVPDRGTGD